MSPSEEFGENGREAALDGTPIDADAAEAAPTHLLTMTRGAPDAVPDRVVVALNAMGIKVQVLEGRGLGLAFFEDVPEFLRRAPFRLELLADLSDRPEPGAEPATGGAAAALPGAPEAGEDDGGASDHAGPLSVPNGGCDALDAAAACLDDDDDEASEAEAGLAQRPDPAGAEEDGAQIRVVENGGLADLPEPEEAQAAPVAAAGLAADPQADAAFGERIDRIMDRLELIEFMLAEQRGSAESAPSPEAGRDLETRLDGIEEALAQIPRVEARLADGFSHFESLFQRAEDALADLTARPAPAADLADRPLGPADLDVVLGTVLERIDALAGRIEDGRAEMLGDMGARLDRIDAVAGRLEAGQAEILGDIRERFSQIDARLDAADTENAAAVSASVEAEAMASVITALSEQLVAARGATAQGETGAVLESLAATQEGIVSMITQLLERPETRFQASDHESLRDLRILVAELLAENRRIAAA
jgi:hypothetical protein